MHWPPTFDVPPFTVLGSLCREESTAGGLRCQCVLTEVATTIIPLFICWFHHLKEGEEHIMKLFIMFITSYRHYLLFLKHLQSLFFLQNKRPNFTPVTVLPFYFPNKFKRLECGIVTHIIEFWCLGTLCSRYAYWNHDSKISFVALAARYFHRSSVELHSTFTLPPQVMGLSPTPNWPLILASWLWFMYFIKSSS